MTKFILVLLMVSTVGCSSVTLRTDNQVKTHSSASFQKTYSYWWWGFKGEYDVNVREVCQGKKVKQMQAVSTFTDVLSFVFTLGIYAPRTARVWCEEKELKL